MKAKKKKKRGFMKAKKKKKTDHCISRGAKLAMETIFKIESDYDKRMRRKKKAPKIPKDHEESFDLYGDCRVPGCRCMSRPVFSRVRF